MSVRNRKIIFVSDVSIVPVIGGAERVLFEQARQLVRYGHDINILTRKLNHHDSEMENFNGIIEWRYPFDSRNSLYSLKSSIANSRRLFKNLCLKNSFEDIVFHQPFSAIGIICSRQAKNKKKIYICHSLSFEEYVSRNEKPQGILAIGYWINVTIRKWIEKKVLNASDSIIVLSQFTKSRLTETYRISPGKISIVPGGVDLKKFKPAVDKIELRRRLDLPEGKVILFTVRNLVQRMGLENLIETLSEIKKEAPDIFMVIGGEGALRETLEARSKELKVKEFIKFTGFIPEDLLPDYYSAADIFILPTRELEGFGLVTIESMASGVAVLGTPVGGTKEILGKFDPTFLFKDTSPKAMAKLALEKYRFIKEKPNEWKEISKKCRQFVEENYTWERHVAALRKYF